MKNPIQPIITDDAGAQRFKANAVVNHLYEWARLRGMGLNELAYIKFSADDRQQFAQLIGYSVDGYGTLSYVDDVAYKTATLMAEGLDERNAMIVALGYKLSELREAIDKLRTPMACLLEMHPDDLKAT